MEESFQAFRKENSMNCPKCHALAEKITIIDNKVTKSGRTCVTREGYCPVCSLEFKKHYYTDMHRLKKGPAE